MFARDARPKFDPTAARLRPFPGGRGLDRSNPFIYIGGVRGVKLARARRGSLICPLDIDPMAFTWPAEGLAVVLVTDDDKIEKAARLTRALLRDGARLVVCIAAQSGETQFRYSNEGVDI